ncbi:MAG TPA: hypothetical protein H9755_12700 [Candidatus Dietzia intestinigallinarum]|nr:hypothetical protein [Candidatus Dietzia intestinigallinarum]
MPDFEFDVDASIAAGWERFAARLAGFLRDLVPGATFDLAVPSPGTRAGITPYIRFTAERAGGGSTPAVAPGGASATPGATAGTGSIEAEISGGGREDDPVSLRAGQLDQLAGLGWTLPDPHIEDDDDPTTAPRPRLSLPTYEATRLARLVAATIERVFGIPHPVFLHDVIDDGRPAGADGPAATERSPAVPEAAPVADDVDFRPIMITDPDQATRAVAAALSEIYHCRVEADEHDVFTVPAGCVVVFVRVHRSMPLIVFRSPLVPAVEDAGAAETEVAILNRDSLWCRYVFDGTSVYAESELVDRVFVPVNFKIHFTEISAELDDVYPDLARRVAAKQWRDLHSADDPETGEQ